MLRPEIGMGLNWDWLDTLVRLRATTRFRHGCHTLMLSRRSTRQMQKTSKMCQTALSKSRRRQVAEVCICTDDT